MKRILLLSGLLAAGFNTAYGDQLTVTLAGVQHNGGTVRVGLYREPDTFRKEAKAFAIRQMPAASGEVTVIFDNIESGTYAIMAYHDEDGNGQLNRRFGMFPTEGYGLSNNPKVMGPPAFKDSAFRVDGATAVSIEMHY